MTVAAPANRVSPAVLAQEIGDQLRRAAAGEPDPVVVVTAEPDWPHEPQLVLTGDRRARVVACPSPLAIWQHLVTRPDGEVLILLTPLRTTELGDGIRSRIFRQRAITIEPWDVVLAAFGARNVEPALAAESWAGSALLEAMPAGGWPKLDAASVLSRDVALGRLAAARFGLDPTGPRAADLDVPTLLRWTRRPGAVDAFATLRAEERAGLGRWLTGRLHHPARAVIALIDAGHGPDALPLGLVCDAVWSSADQEAARAQGRIDPLLGAVRGDDDTIRRYAAACVETVTGMLADRDDQLRREAHGILDRAEELLTGLAATGCAGHSRILRTGFAHRLDRAAAALSAAASATGAPSATGAASASLDAELDSAVAAVAEHVLAVDEAAKVTRVRMARRLLRWLASHPAAADSVADGIHQQISDLGWVDRALAQVWAGDDMHAGLQAAYRDIHQQATRRRRAIDEAFAGRLAAWTTAGPGNDGDLLAIEQVRRRVVDPLIAARRPTLFIVLDGMSAAVAVELAAELRHQWDEYDPVAGGGPARRRAAVAALPTLTAVSRTSLFAGELREGNQVTERQMFTAGRWGERAVIFHKGPSRGGAGEVYADDLRDAVADPARLVAVVINTVDDTLAYGREGDEPGWQLGQIGFLRSLLDLARSAGRAVIITSDHGHVLDHGATARATTDALSARHRRGDTPPADGEMVLAGPRVVAPGHRIVALWDPALRYRPTRAGYHGGASLAEVTVPLLAFLPPNAANPPAGWAALGPQHPDWWQPARTAVPAVAAPTPAAPPRPAGGRQRRAPAPVEGEQPLFAVPTPTAAPPAAPAPTGADLVDALLTSNLYVEQRDAMPRRPADAKVAAALRALVEAGGVLPLAVLAQRAGEAPLRATGFVTTLQRVLNVDSYPVLSLTDQDRTVRLNQQLLREQFGLPGAGERR
ncbi:BREX-2 system phosphatase PglZ [Solwaraspora sp. WMMD792]|uniref:BREX-2 system phosphatase PglZ n=1 Tax=Solwaraspora sp. WMMD792 TaxID=3016099 RepID=UPI0024179E5D|nr:BREX-2 system phosphatase PglZ [Solwaraspora sp. WMMD792]MDG4771155.1 BREX-2 system phosphatase PglZ [Solwaraspora sp. WMMD792]